jgi:hypothetical protein
MGELLNDELLHAKPNTRNLFSLSKETDEIDKDFRKSLQQFGLEQHYIDRFDPDMVPFFYFLLQQS